MLSGHFLHWIEWEFEKFSRERRKKWNKLTFIKPLYTRLGRATRQGSLHHRGACGPWLKVRTIHVVPGEAQPQQALKIRRFLVYQLTRGRKPTSYPMTYEVTWLESYPFTVALKQTLQCPLGLVAEIFLLQFSFNSVVLELFFHIIKMRGKGLSRNQRSSVLGRWTPRSLWRPRWHLRKKYTCSL